MYRATIQTTYADSFPTQYILSTYVVEQIITMNEVGTKTEKCTTRRQQRRRSAPRITICLANATTSFMSSSFVIVVVVSLTIMMACTCFCCSASVIGVVPGNHHRRRIVKNNYISNSRRGGTKAVEGENFLLASTSTATTTTTSASSSTSSAAAAAAATSNNNKNVVVQLFGYVKTSITRTIDGCGQLWSNHGKCNAIRKKIAVYRDELKHRWEEENESLSNEQKQLLKTKIGGISFEEYSFLQKGKEDRGKVMNLLFLMWGAPRFLPYALLFNVRYLYMC